MAGSGSDQQTEAVGAEEPTLTWFFVREPKCVPVRKGPFPPQMVKSFIRELIDARPNAYIDMVTLDGFGHPDVCDAPEWLVGLDGRSAPKVRTHHRTSFEAHDALARTAPRREDGLREMQWLGTYVGDGLEHIQGGCGVCEQGVTADWERGHAETCPHYKGPRRPWNPQIALAQPAPGAGGETEIGWPKLQLPKQSVDDFVAAVAPPDPERPWSELHPSHEEGTASLTCRECLQTATFVRLEPERPEAGGDGSPLPELISQLEDEIAVAAAESKATALERHVASALVSEHSRSRGLSDKVWVVSLPDAQKAIAAVREFYLARPTPPEAGGELADQPRG